MCSNLINDPLAPGGGNGYTATCACIWGFLGILGSVVWSGNMSCCTEASGVQQEMLSMWDNCFHHHVLLLITFNFSNHWSRLFLFSQFVKVARSLLHHVACRRSAWPNNAAGRENGIASITYYTHWASGIDSDRKAHPLCHPARFFSSYCPGKRRWWMKTGGAGNTECLHLNISITPQWTCSYFHKMPLTFRSCLFKVKLTLKYIINYSES